MNNPALLGYFTAHKDFQDVDSLLLVSLGTGDTRKGAQGSDLEGGGILFWASSLVDIMIDGASAVNDQLLQSHFLQKTSPGSYYRLQAVLHPDLHEMDTKDRDKISRLKKTGESIVSKYSQQLDEIIEKIKIIKKPAHADQVEEKFAASVH